MAEIRFEHVNKTYGTTEIIKDLSLEIHDREFLVLVGPSGCGKSTTLRMIAGLESISGGDLWIGKTRVNDVPPKDRDIAMVFQNYALYPHMSVKQNLEFSLKLRNMNKEEIKARMQETAGILGLDQLLDRKPKQLSGGQRQRVAMGRAIVRNPAVFLFDEPLSNLDAKLRVQMRVELAKLHKKLNTTIVYVTHDQIEAMTLADRIVVMNGGIIQQVGTPLELYRNPVNSFVGAFIGSPVMNQVMVKVENKNDEIYLVGEGFEFALPQQLADSLKQYHEQKILLGIRPEDIEPCREGEQKIALKSHIEVIELMGGESYIYFSLRKKQWVARCEGAPAVKEGEQALMALDPDKFHIFSEDGSKRLLTGE